MKYACRLNRTFLATWMFWTLSWPEVAWAQASEDQVAADSDVHLWSEDASDVASALRAVLDAPRHEEWDPKILQSAQADSPLRSHLEGTRSEAVREHLLDGLEGEQASPEQHDAPTLDEASDSLTAPQTVALEGSGPSHGAGGSAIKLPTGQGSIEGLGESFKAELSTGLGTYGIPFQVPPGRGEIAPSLVLAYNSAASNGEAGLGWSLGGASIVRVTNRGVPRYVDREAWHAQEDRFSYAGRDLVPVNTSEMEKADCGRAGCAPVPSELQGYQQYRAEIEGAFLRFFRAPDGTRWVVQDPGGTRYDFGQLPVGTGPSEAVQASTAALERESDDAGAFRWSLVRTSDAHGNVMHRVHFLDGGRSYLRDVYYVSPHAQCGALSPASERRNCSAPFSAYAHHVRFVYEPRADVSTSFASGFPITTGLRVKRVEITSAQGAAGSGRSLVRRYHLGYDGASFHSLLRTLTVEGRHSRTDPASGALSGDQTTREETLGDAIVGDLFPPLTFSYSEQPNTAQGVPEFGGIDHAVRRAVASPPVSLSDPRVAFFDINSDGLPDLVHTAPAKFRKDGSPAVGAYFNGFSGPDTRPSHAGSFSAGIPLALTAGMAGVMTLTNLNLATLDVDGDGRAEFVHMPEVGTYGYFVVGRTGPSAAPLPGQQGWSLAYVDRPLPRGSLNPRIDLGNDAEHIQVLDVTGDGLIDVLRSTGTELQLFMNLGNFPGGDGRFGSRAYENDQLRLSSAPVRSCLPMSGGPVDFADPGIHVADMNADGLPDIVEVRPGHVAYWAGRGERGFGAAERCSAGRVPEDVQMENAPHDLSLDPGSVNLADVNGDGAPDLLQLAYDSVSVWFNEYGRGFSERVTADRTPQNPSSVSNVRVSDVDGTGTLDVVWGDANNYRWIDLMGGVRPRLLTRVENGLGGEARLTYGTSTEDYLRDLSAAAACTGSDCQTFTWNPSTQGCDEKVRAAAHVCLQRASGSPLVNSVVRSSEITDHLDALGAASGTSTTLYRYHDAYYEGVEREFRGFGAAEQELISDQPSTNQVQQSRFHVGQRPDEIAADPLANNPNAALQGLIHTTEVYDASGRFLSSIYTSHTVHRVARGLDGRDITFARSAQVDELTYDNAPFEASSDVLELPGVSYVDALGGTDLPVAGTRTVRVRGKRHADVRSLDGDVDALGHVLTQTAYGRVLGEFGEVQPDEPIVTHQEMQNVPGSESGWLWGSSYGYLTGSAPGTRYKETRTQFDVEGSVVRTEQLVNQPLYPTFPAFGDAQGFGTPAPRSLVVTTQHDPWGSERASCAGEDAQTGSDCLRYHKVEYDADYALFASRESVASVRRPDGSIAYLDTRGEFDRGFGLLLAAHDPNGNRTTVTYDGFGRQTSITLPNAADCPSTRPSVVTRYDLTSDPRARPLNRMTVTKHVSCDGATPLVLVQYVDGLGRTRAVLSNGDGVAGKERVQAGIQTFDRRGRMARQYEPAFFAGSEDDLGAVLRPAVTNHRRVVYDAFDRVRGDYAANGDATWTDYHALSTDVCDPLDLDPSSRHVGTCTTTRLDGHGRPIDQVLRNRQPGRSDIEHYRLWSTYRPDGQLVRLERAQTNGDRALPLARQDVVLGRSIERRFAIDSVGRLLASNDPDSDNRQSGATWRYLWNPAGDMAAIRDPRGCGKNYYYDLAGRLLGEQYVGCAEALVQQGNTVDAVPPGSVGLAPLTTPQPVAVRNFYDSYAGSWAPAPQTFEDYPSAYASDTLGNLVATADRGQRSVFAFDARGNPLWSACQMALPAPAPAVAAMVQAPAPPQAPAPSFAYVQYDEHHTYVRSLSYDSGDRLTSVVLPRDPDFADGEPGPRVQGSMSYNPRGLPAGQSLTLVHGGGAPVRAAGRVAFGPGSTGEQHTIVQALEYDRDGALLRTVYGDARPGHAATESKNHYDVRRRLDLHQTVRTPTAAATDEPSLSAVSLVTSQELAWDGANNLTEIVDKRVAREWPEGRKPQSMHIDHDSLYRVVDVEFDYTRNDGLVGPADAASDYRVEFARAESVDAMRTIPAPMLAKLPASRVASITWQYDWLGNSTEWDDDAQAFYERSLGKARNGADSAQGIGAQPVLRPSALYVAASLEGFDPEDRGGYAEVDYGDDGNVVAMTVHARCADRTPQRCAAPAPSTPEAERSALLASCLCRSEQHYQYLWDELNRLAEARRYDRVTGAGPWALEVRQRYQYDGQNGRTLKQTLSVEDDDERVSLSIYEGDLERRGLITGVDRYEGDPSIGSETQYLISGARVVWQAGAAGQRFDARHRISVPISDVIGTTAAVLDLVSGELLEYSTYYPNGGRETMMLADQAAPEPRGFTGKEADEEVGLTYFGERYLIPRLGRWASPDPAQIHAAGGGEALNGYHYIGGSLIQGRDPIGLCKIGEDCYAPWNKQPDEALCNGQKCLTDREVDEAGKVDTGEDMTLYAPDTFEKRYRGAMAEAWDSGCESCTDTPDRIFEYGRAHGWFGPWEKDLVRDRKYRLINKDFERDKQRAEMAAAQAWRAEEERVEGFINSPGLAGFTVARIFTDHEHAQKIGDWVNIAATLYGGYRFLRGGRPKAPPATPVANCFAAGTLVQTARGQLPIEEVQAGDYVWSLSLGSGKTALRPVTRTHVTEDQPLLDVTLENVVGVRESLASTHGHPFWTRQLGWVSAQYLEPGDEILARNGSYLRVVSLHDQGVRATVYNFEVDDYHAYFVGALEAFVHNGSPREAQRIVRNNTVKKNRNDYLGITRIDAPEPGANVNSQWEAHVGGMGSPAIQLDGTWKHVPNGQNPPRLQKAAIKFLREHGWKI